MCTNKTAMYQTGAEIDLFHCFMLANWYSISSFGHRGGSVIENWSIFERLIDLHVWLELPAPRENRWSNCAKCTLTLTQEQKGLINWSYVISINPFSRRLPAYYLWHVIPSHNQQFFRVSQATTTGFSTWFLWKKMCGRLVLRKPSPGGSTGMCGSTSRWITGDWWPRRSVSVAFWRNCWAPKWSKSMEMGWVVQVEMVMVYLLCSIPRDRPNSHQNWHHVEKINWD